MLLAARARDEAITLADDGRYGEARDVLEKMGDALRQRPSERLIAEARSLDEASMTLVDASYATMPSARKTMRYASQQTRRRRDQFR